MPDYMNEFDDDFEYKNEPDDTTPDDAENAGIALKNTRLLKRFINDVVAGRIDLKIGNLESKNYFNPKDPKAFHYGSGVFSQFADNGDGSYTTQLNIANTRTKGTPLKLKKNTTYTASIFINEFENLDETSGKGIYFEVLGYKTDEGENQILGGKTDHENNHVSSFTFNSGDYPFWAMHITGSWGVGGKGKVTFSQIQVEEGSEFSGYSPYIDFKNL